MPASDIAGWVFGGTAGAGLLAWLIRHLVITVFSTKSEVSRITAGDHFTEKLYAEIHRLEAIIKKLNDRLAEMEYKIECLRRSELSDMADIAQIEAVVNTSCVGQKSCPSNKQLKEALDRIRARRP